VPSRIFPKKEKEIFKISLSEIKMDSTNNKKINRHEKKLKTN
jgi:hypothetical protein